MDDRKFKVYEEESGGVVFYDMALIAYLMVEGHRLRGTKMRGEKLFFIFEDDETLQKDALNFFNNKALVNPVAFSNCIKQIKGAVSRGGL